MEFNEGQAIYLQIADYIMNLVLKGEWKEGERIPSVREMAVQMQVNPNTAMRTFAHLQEKEVIFNKRGIGYFIAVGGKERARAIKKDDFLTNVVPEFIKNARLLGFSGDDIVKMFNDEN